MSQPATKDDVREALFRYERYIVRRFAAFMVISVIVVLIAVPLLVR